MTNPPISPIRQLPYGYPSLSETGGDMRAALSDLAKNTALAHNINMNLMQRIAASFVVTATAPASMEVQVWPGALLNQGQLVEKGIQTSPQITAPLAQNRIDRIDLNGTTGAVVYTKGLEAASPATPALPGGCYPLALISLVPGQTSIGQKQITDKRVFGTVGAITPPPPPPPPPPVLPAFYVSPSGNDGNNGTDPTTPFKTIEAGQNAARASTTVKLIYLRAGTYARTATLGINSQDAGITISYYPPDGVNTAILDGGATLSGANWINGTATAISFALNAGSLNFILDGIKIQHFTTYGLLGSNGEGHVTVRNCDIGNMGSVGGGVGSSNLLAAADHWTINNNFFHDCPSAGITIWAFNSGDSCDGTIADRNVCMRISTGLGDSGVIYTNMRSSGTAGGAVTISNNYVRDNGSSSLTADMNDIYLDDNSSNVTVTGNVIGPPTAINSNNRFNSAAVFGNGNSTNTQNKIKNNIIDTGSSGMYGVGYVFGASNILQNNIVIGNFTLNPVQTAGGSMTGNAYTGASSNTISNNMYKNYGGGDLQTSGNPGGDTASVSADPKLSGFTYILDPTSPAFLAVGAGGIGFVDIPRNWGPLGTFTIPQTGAPPSCPH